MELNNSDAKTTYTIEDIEPDGSADFPEEENVFDRKKKLVMHYRIIYQLRELRDRD